MTSSSKFSGEAPSEHDEVQLLLPWWVNETLNEQQQQRVADHLPQCSICQREVHQLTALSNTLNDDMRFDSSLIDNTLTGQTRGASVEAHLSQVMQRIDAQQGANRLSARSASQPTSQPTSQQASQPTSQPADDESLLQRLTTTLSSILWPAPAYRWGSAVAVVCVLVLGFQLLPGQSGSEFSVLSSGEQSTQAMQLTVHFSEAVSPSDAQKLLVEYSSGQEAEFTLEQIDDTRYVMTYTETIEASTLMDTVRKLQAAEAIDRVELQP